MVALYNTQRGVPNGGYLMVALYNTQRGVPNGGYLMVALYNTQRGYLRGGYLMVASNTCTVVQGPLKETLSTVSCTALINSLALPIIWRRVKKGNDGSDVGNKLCC